MDLGEEKPAAVTPLENTRRRRIRITEGRKKNQGGGEEESQRDAKRIKGEKEEQKGEDEVIHNPNNPPLSQPSYEDEEYDIDLDDEEEEDEEEEEEEEEEEDEEDEDDEDDEEEDDSDDSDDSEVDSLEFMGNSDSDDSDDSDVEILWNLGSLAGEHIDIEGIKKGIAEVGKKRIIFKEVPTNEFNIRTTSNHFQCANSIVFPDFEKNHQVFCFAESNVICYNIYTNEINEDYSFTVSFRPLCLTCNYDLVVLGGSNGQIAIFSLTEKKLLTERYIGHMTNTVEVIYHQNRQKIVVADNDGSVSVYAFPSLEKETNVGRFNYGVNACKMSPDGKYLAAIGDFPEIFLIPIEANNFGSPIPLVEKREGECVTIVSGWKRTTEDFPNTNSVNYQYVAWNATSSILAVTSDSHSYATIWNVPEKTMISRVYTGGSSFPILFSMSKESTFVFANRKKALHAFDLKTNDHQIIELPTKTRINGICFSPDFHKLYAATQVGIYEYELNGVNSLLDKCVKFIQTNRELPIFKNFDWKLLPRNLLVKIFPYGNLQH